MRSNFLYSFAAVFAAFAQFAAVFSAFTIPVAAIADQAARTMATVSVTQEPSVSGVEELIVEVPRPL